MITVKFYVVQVLPIEVVSHRLPTGSPEPVSCVIFPGNIHLSTTAMADLEWKPFSLTYVEYPKGQ